MPAVRATPYHITLFASTYEHIGMSFIHMYIYMSEYISGIGSTHRTTQKSDEISLHFSNLFDTYIFHNTIYSTQSLQLSHS